MPLSNHKTWMYIEECNDLEINNETNSKIGNRSVINKYTQPLLGNALVNKHVPT